MPACLPGFEIACDVVGDAAGAVVGSAFDSVVEAFAKGLADAIKIMMSFWVNVPTPQLSDTTGPVAALRGDLAWLTGAVALAAFLVAAGRLAVTRHSEAAVDISRSSISLLLATFLGVPVIAALTVFGDQLATWVLAKSATGDLGARLAQLSVASGTGGGLLLLISILGILGSLVQILLMLARVAVLTLLAGSLPLFAAASSSKTGRASYHKALAWVLAFVLYKPAAALIYAASFYLVGDGKTVVEALSGLLLLLMAPIALPALLRLLTPAVGAALSAGTAGAGAAFGSAVATGAVMVNRRSSSGAGAAGGFGGAGRGGGSPSGSGPGPTGSPVGSPKGGGPSGGAAGGSAAGAAGGLAAAVPLAGVAVQGAKSAHRVIGAAVPSGDEGT